MWAIWDKALGSKAFDEVNKTKGRPGKIWVSNDELNQNKMIMPDEITEGWYKGRTKY